MSTADLLGTPADPPRHHGETDDPHAEERRRLLRTAGWAGVGGFVAWLCQPLLVALLSSSDTDVPTLATLEAAPWVGTVEGVLFSVIGCCLLTLVLATWRVLGLARPHASVASTVGLVMGLLAGAGWLLAAAGSLSLYTSVGAGLAEVSPRAEVQAAALQASYIAITAALVLVAVGSTGWYVMLLTAGRHSGLVGTPLAVLLALLLLGPAYQLATPWAAPWGLVTFVLGSLVLGVAMLVKARR